MAQKQRIRTHTHISRGGTPYNGLYSDAPPRKGHLFQARGIERGRNFTSLGIDKCEEKGQTVGHLIYERKVSKMGSIFNQNSSFVFPQLSSQDVSEI